MTFFQTSIIHPKKYCSRIHCFTKRNDLNFWKNIWHVKYDVFRDLTQYILDILAKARSLMALYEGSLIVDRKMVCVDLFFASGCTEKGPINVLTRGLIRSLNTHVLIFSLSRSRQKSSSSVFLTLMNLSLFFCFKVLSNMADITINLYIIGHYNPSVRIAV